jgi:hypothetical protein
MKPPTAAGILGLAVMLAHSGKRRHQRGAALSCRPARRRRKAMGRFAVCVRWLGRMRMVPVSRMLTVILMQRSFCGADRINPSGCRYSVRSTTVASGAFFCTACERAEVPQLARPELRYFP